MCMKYAILETNQMQTRFPPYLHILIKVKLPKASITFFFSNVIPLAKLWVIYISYCKTEV